VLVNAVYFKGSWLNKFDKHRTSPGEFHPSPKVKKVINVQMMHINEKMRYLDNQHDNDGSPKYQAVAVPFDKKEGDDTGLHMVIVLPEDIDQFNQAIKTSSNAFNKVDWVQKILTRLFRETYGPGSEVFLNIPRFKLTTESTSLKKQIEALGITKLFTPKVADLSGVTGSPNDLYVSDIVHKAVIEVNEEGAEAAAATGIIAITCMLPVDEPPVILVDRPCFLMIVDEKELCPIFFGRLTEPEIL